MTSEVTGVGYDSIIARGTSVIALRRGGVIQCVDHVQQPASFIHSGDPIVVSRCRNRRTAGRNTEVV